jgi:hypothetical protein
MRKHQSIPLSIRKEIFEYVETLILLPPEEVIIPDFHNGPIPGLDVIFNGWKCVDSNCIGYLSATEQTDGIEIHCRQHGWKVCQNRIGLIFQSMENPYFGPNVLCKPFSKENISSTLK